MLEEEAGPGEEVGAEGAELMRKEAAAAEELEEEAKAPVAAEEEEEVAEYHPISVDLVKTLLDAVDIMVALAEGKINITEARRLYSERVVEPAAALAATAPPRTKAKKSQKKSKKTKSSKKTSKSSSKKKSKSSSKKKSAKEASGEPGS